MTMTLETHRAMTAPRDDRIAIQMNVTRTFAEGSGATWVTSMPQDTAIEDINVISDKMMSAIARQEIWARIASLNNDIEKHCKDRAQVEFSIKALEARHGDFDRANVDARNAYNQSKETLLRIDLLITALKEEQVRLRKELD